MGLNPKADAKVGKLSIPAKLFLEKMYQNRIIFRFIDKNTLIMEQNGVGMAF